MTRQPLALLNARLVNPAAGTETRGGLLIMDGVIADLGGAVTKDALPAGARIIDCAGDILAPGLIDMRAFVGEPGAEHRETMASASAAAAAGGVTTMVAMPDTHPAVDDPAVVDFIKRRARDTARVRVLPSARSPRASGARRSRRSACCSKAAPSPSPMACARSATPR